MSSNTKRDTKRARVVRVLMTTVVELYWSIKAVRLIGRLMNELHQWLTDE